MNIRVLDIITGTTVDGPGLRTSVYLAGCSHHCKGCHNPGSWDSGAGRLMAIDEIMAIIRAEGNDVTLSGGDPLFNPGQTAALAEAIHNAGLKIWLYTGYTWQQIASDKRLLPAVEHVDVIVDGPYIESLSDADLLFRGSLNQRLLKIEHTPRGLVASEWVDMFFIGEL